MTRACGTNKYYPPLLCGGVMGLGLRSWGGVMGWASWGMGWPRALRGGLLWICRAFSIPFLGGSVLDASRFDVSDIEERNLERSVLDVCGIAMPASVMKMGVGFS